MATIDSLPPEILIEIMMECDLHDMATLIKFSPLFLQLFSVHRQHLLKSVVNVLRPDYPDCEPHLSLRMSTLASRIRCQKRLDATTEEAEAVNDHLFQYRDSELDLSTSTDLSILRDLSRLHTEAKYVVNEYAWVCWCSIYDRYKSMFPKVTPATYPTSLLLSQTERWRFVQTAIHYDAFCQMFFLNGEILFKDDQSKRERFFEVSERDGIGAEHIYALADFILEEYSTLFSDVLRILEEWEKWEDLRKKKRTGISRLNPKIIFRQGKKKVSASIKYRKHQMFNCVGECPDPRHVDRGPPSPEVEANLHLWKMYTSRFKQYTPRERETFTHFLMSQGLSMVHNVWQMSYERQTEFVLEMFYRLNEGKEVTVDDGSYWRYLYWEPWMGTYSLPVYRHTFAVRNALEFWDMDRFHREDGRLLE